MDINSVLRRDFVRHLIVDVCGHNIEIIKRNDCFVIRNKEEGERDLDRVILLPPRGFTANAINQMNSHDEVDYATVQVKGAVKNDKNGFSKLKDCLMVVSVSENGLVSELNQPYLTYGLMGTDSNASIKRYSAGTPPVPVVKNDGYGFYHNLINVTDDWLVLKLHKKLRPQKKVDLVSVLTNVPSAHAEYLNELYSAVIDHGDTLFHKSPKLVSNVMSIPMEVSFPVLSEMLHVHDSGKHEACTVFAVMLKIGGGNPMLATNWLQKAMQAESIPKYYARQLMDKIERRMDQKKLCA